MLIYIEPTLPFESLELSNTANDKPDFPSKEFGDFIELLVKWNLSDAYSSDILYFSRNIYYEDTVLPTSIKQGYQFLDQMTVLHLHFEKTAIIVYQNETYYLYH